MLHFIYRVNKNDQTSAIVQSKFVIAGVIFNIISLQISTTFFGLSLLVEKLAKTKSAVSSNG